MRAVRATDMGEVSRRGQPYCPQRHRGTAFFAPLSPPGRRQEFVWRTHRHGGRVSVGPSRTMDSRDSKLASRPKRVPTQCVSVPLRLPVV